MNCYHFEPKSAFAKVCLLLNRQVKPFTSVNRENSPNAIVNINGNLHINWCGIDVPIYYSRH